MQKLEFICCFTCAYVYLLNSCGWSGCSTISELGMSVHSANIEETGTLAIVYADRILVHIYVYRYNNCCIFLLKYVHDYNVSARLEEPTTGQARARSINVRLCYIYISSFNQRGRNCPD